MGEEKRSFWDMVLGPYSSGREDLVLEYVIHRLGDGANLEDILREQYVRRHASPDEVQDILDNPELVEAARKKMEEDFEKLGRVFRARRRDK
jgi:hypothetical protein